MGKNAKRLAIGSVIAAGAGYLTGILTAPKSGKETRKDIKDTAVRTKAEAEKKLKVLHSEIDTLIKTGTTHAKTLKDLAAKEMTDALGKAVVAKEKMRELLSKIHEEGAEDDDLKSAIKEANEAIDHLKKFIAKHAK